MKVTVQSQALARELQHAARVAEAKSPILVLSHVLLDARGAKLHLGATDLETSLRSQCGAQAVIGGDGRALLPAKKLLDVLKTLPDTEVTLEVDDQHWATLRAQGATFKLPGLDPEDFPELPTAKGAQDAVELPAAALKALIRRTSFAIADSSARYYLAGALLVLEPRSMALVATDGHRLAYAQVPLESPLPQAEKLLIPRATLLELERLVADAETVKLQQTPNHMLFTVGTSGLAAKKIEGQFPAYEKVIDKRGATDVELPADGLRQALRRTLLFAGEKNKAVALRLSGGKLRVAAQESAGQAEDVLDAEGEAPEIGVNGQFVLDFLGATGAERVTLNVGDAEQSLVFRPVSDDEGDYRYIVMPVRL